MGQVGSGALLAALLSSVAVGCGGGAEHRSTAAPSSPSDTAFPVTVRDATRAVTIPRRPERIVSLSPSATETLFAVGAGPQVVAVDDESDHPAGVPRTDLSSYQPNVEAIVGYRPDLVILPDTVPRDVVAGLRRLDVPVLAEPAPDQLGEAYRQMRAIGLVTGHREAGIRLAERVRAQVDAAVERAPDLPGLTVFHELDPELFTVSSRTFIGRIYTRLGVENIADPAAARSGNAYPQLSAEAVVSADPDLVILADGECCEQTRQTVAARPGWDAVSAVRSGAVVTIDDDVASRWGPRIPELVDRVAEAMEAAEPR
ncbi:MAG TPA: ABC transporter substrate-binding protein [Capillimicrobium sp.]|jgi:iron complex transport system substrate-binding protein